MYTDLMIDIEALGSVVTQIGAVAFNLDMGERDVGVRFNLNRKEQIQKGLTLDLGPTEFWLEQVFNTSRLPSWMKKVVGVDKAIHELSCYVQLNCMKPNIWCHNYDINYLDKLGKAFNHGMPWSYRQFRELRTMCEIGKRLGWETERKIKPHDALGDAHYQVTYICDCWRFIKMRSLENRSQSKENQP